MAALPPIKAFRGIFKKATTANSFGDDSYFVVDSLDAKAIVAAVETGHSYQAICLIKRQPWYADLAKANGQ